MLEKNQKFGVYTVKEVLHSEGFQTCCLTEDPFFHSAVILNVFSIEEAGISDQRRTLSNRLDQIFLLEHSGIAAIYDSGYEGDFFYYTTSYNYLEPLGSIIERGLAVKQVIKLMTELIAALNYAATKKLLPGPIMADKVFINDKGEAVIADFGIQESFALVHGRKSYSQQLDETLYSLGQLLLQLLTAKHDINLREDELLDQLDSQSLKLLCLNLLGRGDKTYADFSEPYRDLLELKEAQQEDGEQPLSTAVDNSVDRVNISLREKKDVLPQVRKLIKEKNQLILQLDEATLEYNRLTNRLTDAQRQVEELSVGQQAAAEVRHTDSRTYMVLACCTVLAFLLGLAASTFFRISTETEQSSTYAAVATQSPAVETLGVPEAVAEVARPESVERYEELDEAVEEAVDQNPVVSSESVKPADEDPGRENVTEPVALPAPVQNMEWWPAGQEFSEEAAQDAETVSQEDVEFISGGHLAQQQETEIVNSLKNWATAWSSQDVDGYLNSYSRDYAPSNGLSHEQWSQKRRELIGKAQWLKIDLENIQLEEVRENLVNVTFDQVYLSNTYSDHSKKEIQLVRKGDDWKIESEKTLSITDH